MRRFLGFSAGSAIVLASLVGVGCRDTAGFSTGSGHYEGAVLSGDFVRSGIADQTRACVTLDADHLQDTPGALWTSDGRFEATPLRPIPQIWHDPLSTLTFGEGRTKNLIYVVTPNGEGGLSSADVFAVVSLMQTGTIEVRLMRGAPSADGGDVGNDDIFGVFDLDSKPGACPF
ncbi:MAG TPA: hypothetical protein VF407_06675 [Polyangiaceae bacterium]